MNYELTKPKYPSTKHLPWSLHVTTDDKKMSEDEVRSVFTGQDVVVTVKMDGENSTLTSEYYHARSPNGRDHLSRHWLKGFHSVIRHNIPPKWRIIGENMFAEHSIHYKGLPGYLLVFSVVDPDNVALTWDDTSDISKYLGLPTVPVLYRGIYDEEKIKSLFDENKPYFIGTYDVKKKEDTGKEIPAEEGYVVRLASSFSYPQSVPGEKPYFKEVSKFVRKKHVQTSEHWLLKPVVKNELAE